MLYSIAYLCNYAWCIHKTFVQNELHERSPFSLNLTQNDASRSYGIHIYSC